jgi:glycosyltransferase involved in cell wall biosynthesis
VNLLFVTYDGLFDPLGATQVLPYVEGLADRGVAFTIISFEKRERDAPANRAALEQRLRARRIRWTPLRYRKRPRLPATLLDCALGVRAIRSALRTAGGVDVVHCRGDVAMTMARLAAGKGTPIVYDVRGLYSDERVESGSWARGSLVDRLVRRAEAANLRRADGIVALTAPAITILAGRRPALPPHRVIPTCVDLEAFAPRGATTPVDFGLVYSGSAGGWYMTEEMVAFAREAAAIVGGRAIFLTPQPEEFVRAGAGGPWSEVREVAPAAVPGWLRRCRALFFFIRATPAKRASCPTKLGEALATGLPVVANRGIGDLDDILESEGVGVHVEEFSAPAYRDAAMRLVRLLGDPETAVWCRRVAERRYGLPSAVVSYHGLYEELVKRRPLTDHEAADRAPGPSA